MQIISNKYIDSVVSIGYNNSKDELVWIGTGFLVGHKKLDECYIYIITNYHIIEGKNSVFVKFNQIHENNTTDYILSLYDENGLPLFTKHKEADIIAIRIRPEVLKRGESIFDYFSIEDDFFKLKDMKNSCVTEGNFIYGLGYPLNMVDKIKSKPICRIGCISRISDVIDNDNSLEYLVDLPSYPGNSGGPVIAMVENNNDSKGKLVGIIHSCISYKEECFNEETGKIDHVYEENSGLALVHSANLIIETIELYERIFGR